ncbi:unnamed protein product [Closterium sp. NIES-53]
MKNAFLYALVDAVIYVEQPHTYGEGDSRVCQLRKSLYRIKHASRLWQQYLHNILLEIGFKQQPHDPGMYRRDFRGDYILLTVDVVDLLYTGSSSDLLEQFERNLAGRVDIACNHDVKQFLGLNISYSPKAIHLSAAKYVEELGKRPDLSYITSQMAQYSRKPTVENLLDLQRALQFFISTPNIGLCHSTVTTSSFNLTGYVDADHAADPDNRRS